MFTPWITDTVKHGVLIVSGSRSIKDALQWGHYVLELAETRGWAVAIGDASGVDTAVFQAWQHPLHIDKVPLIILGCQFVGKIRIHGYDWHDDKELMTQLIPGGTRSSCFVIRDKALAELGTLAPKAGFAGLWDGYSKGTQHTAKFCRDAGIPGFLQTGMNVIQRWETPPRFPTP